jgi:hypothetical protein
MLRGGHGPLHPDEVARAQLGGHQGAGTPDCNLLKFISDTAGAYHVVAPTGATMSFPTSARRLLALCALVPLSELTQEEVDDIFQTIVEDAPEDVEDDPPALGPGPSATG